MSEALDKWFVENVLPLEAELDAYLQRHWPEPEDIKDFRQDIYVRIYKAAEIERPANTRAFLYATARNLIIDRIRRKRVVSIETVMDFDRWDVPTYDAGPFETLSSRQELGMLQSALESLPDRTKNIVFMRRVQGLSQRDTARRLKVSQPTVERHLSKGVRLLADYLAQQGVLRGPARDQRKGKQHDKD